MNGVDYDRDAKQFRLKLITINQIVRNLILLFLSLYIYIHIHASSTMMRT